MVNPLSVVVDPGHGGRLSYGAMWPPFPSGHGLAGEALETALANHAKTAAVEKDINLNIALALRHLIENSGWPVTCELTRETDEAMPLDTRAAIAAKYAADVVVVIHCDTNPNATVSGLGTYVRPDDDEAYRFATDVGLAVPAVLRRGASLPHLVHPRPHWTGAAYAVLAHHKAPAALFECGFLSCDKDRRLLASEAGQALVANAIMAGIAAFWHRRTAVA